MRGQELSTGIIKFKIKNAKIKIKKSKIAERMAEGEVGGENKLKVKNEK